MSIKFNGRKIRDDILVDLKKKIAALPIKPALAVVWIGDDLVSAKYIEVKKKAADEIGAGIEIIKLAENVGQFEAEETVKNIKADGIIIQLPVPKSLDQQKLIELIPADKDVDGLRFCANLPSNFQPPAVLAILRALDGIDLKSKTVAIVGRGFLVGAPLAKILRYQVAKLTVTDIETADITKITCDADVVISATGQPGLIKTDMIKQDAILIDAGTTEVGGKLRGDIDPAAYEKSSFYTSVPGGIGPVTVAMLLRNLVAGVK